MHVTLYMTLWQMLSQLQHLMQLVLMQRMYSYAPHIAKDSVGDLA